MNRIRIILSVIWSGINQGVRAMVKLGWVRSVVLPTHSIGVGNLQAGGAGKTPLVIEIARQAVARGLSVAVLTRGYRSVWEKSGGVVPPGVRQIDPEFSGDEAALIHDSVPEVWIGVGADRLESYQKICESIRVADGRPLDLVILDDAFQHWKIRCHQSVIAVTDARVGERVFRDRFSAARSSDLIVLTKGEDYPDALKRHALKLKTRFVYPAPPEKISFRLVAAIGDPQRARESLEKAGFAIARLHSFPDHALFSKTEVSRILDDAKNAGERVLLTGKDWVKWRALGISEEWVSVVEPLLAIGRLPVENPDEPVSTDQKLWDRVIWGGLPGKSVK